MKRANIHSLRSSPLPNSINRNRLWHNKIVVTRPESVTGAVKANRGKHHASRAGLASEI